MIQDLHSQASRFRTIGQNRPFGQRMQVQKKVYRATYFVYWPMKLSHEWNLNDFLDVVLGLIYPDGCCSQVAVRVS
jgi:hypothetical protein